MSDTNMSVDVFMYDKPSFCGGWIRSDHGELTTNIDGITFYAQTDAAKRRLIEAARLIVEYADRDTPKGDRLYMETVEP